MDKTKRKGQALNLKRYWLIFGLLSILTIIPVRFIGSWQLTNIFYIFITISLILVVQHIRKRFKAGCLLTGMMILVVAASLAQSFNPTYDSCIQYERDYTKDIPLIVTRCTRYVEGEPTFRRMHFLVFEGTSIGIQRHLLEIRYPYHVGG